MNNITIIGSGAFGTAIAQSLSLNKENIITLFSIEKEQVEEINTKHTNSIYFPNRTLDSNIKATLDIKSITEANIIMIAIPSKVIEDFLITNKTLFNPNSLIINLSKGLSPTGEAITDLLKIHLPQNSITTLKGPTFASELIAGNPSILTLGFDKSEQYDLVRKILEHTNISIDLTSDITGVEYLSVLKNIYSILIGFIDAKYNSSNTRFMLFTKAFREISILLKELGGQEQTLYLSCGLGDFGLTSLNDLSRNRTLGLLIGKGFFTQNTLENSVVVEGLQTIQFISNVLNQDIINKLPLLKELTNYLNKKSDKINIDFKTLLNQENKTVLTYGTFDLLHYGHIEILKRAKALGTKLIVAASSDEFNQLKGKQSILPFQKRKELLESIEYVDMVIPEDNWEQKIKDVQEYKVDIFVMGDDWKGKFDFLKEYCEVIYLPRTKNISTTKLKQIL